MCNGQKVVLNMAHVDCGLIMRALLVNESECGDLGIIKINQGDCFLALLDVLGHGVAAREVALIAQDYIENNYRSDLVDTINGLHVILRGTRGTVAALLHLDINTGKLSYAGIGNITVRILGQNPSRLILRDGIIGYMMSKPEKLFINLLPGDILLIHSDGIREHFDVSECADLFSESAQNIANGMFERFWKKNDDASMIVIKYNL